MTIRTVNDVFYSVVERNSDRVMMVKRQSAWIAISSREFYRSVVGVARELEHWGIGRGDRVAILGENRPEWAVADFACLLRGVVTVPVYCTLTAEQTLHILRDSGARVIFVSTADQLRKILAIKDKCSIERIVLMDEVEGTDTDSMDRLMRNGPDSRDEAFDRRALAIEEEALATIIYTSGTTGTPKGVMLTQGNLAANLRYTASLHDFKRGFVSISFLPLSHVLARHLDYAMMWNEVTVGYCRAQEALAATMRELKPQVLVAVPRVYEKVRNVVRDKFDAGLKRRLYQWAMSVGNAHKDEVLAGKMPTAFGWRLADKLFFSKLRAAFGGRLELAVSGAAPLNRAVLDWYAAIGIRICEGYGMTETSPIISVSSHKSFCSGSVGRIIDAIQVRFASDGEILVTGPSVFKGYWNMPEETAKAFDGDWFHTGDVGRQDADGFLYITDRKKDLIKTSGGKFIAPQPIESRLKSNRLVEEAAVVADGRNFVSAVIVPNFPELKKWAELNHHTFTSREELVANRQVVALYENIVSEINRDLARFETIKRFILVADEFSIANGALTPTMKLKRHYIEQRYAKQLDELYEDRSAPAALRLDLSA
jgi:long-chain acyl-CoA synthetase